MRKREAIQPRQNIVVEAEMFFFIESNTGYIVSARYNESSTGVIEQGM